MFSSVAYLFAVSIKRPFDGISQLTSRSSAVARVVALDLETMGQANFLDANPARRKKMSASFTL